MQSSRCSIRRQLTWACCVLLCSLISYSLQLTTDGNSSTQEIETMREPLDIESQGVVPTLRPLRVSCTPPAIEQFPRPILSQSFRKHGGLLFHIIVCVYSFIGLVIVCNDYFVTSFYRICEEFKISTDVVGATFMAAGSSAPELATVVIGVFFAMDDIGVSGVIGSAVFNIMFVISVCALSAGTTSYLNWWPLCRDCFFYALSILIMLFVIFDEKISWRESLFMLICYVGYCVALGFNTSLEAWVHPYIPCKVAGQTQNSAVYAGTAMSPTTGDPYSTGQPQQTQQQPAALGQITHAPGMAPRPEFYKAKEHDHQVSLIAKPDNTELATALPWRLCLPIHFVCTKTIPDCRSEQYRNRYPFTFLVSMVWISFYSYIMVWMITIIGSTLGIPDMVMWLTFRAAGVNVPNAISRLAAVQKGYGDMAVSNAVGSNVFNILICLGLPWFIQTAMIKPGSYVNIYSKGFTYLSLSLLSTVFFLLFATHANGWKLDKRYGVILMIWYLMFIGFASLYELNVFGFMNPPECFSSY